MMQGVVPKSLQSDCPGHASQWPTSQITLHVCFLAANGQNCIGLVARNCASCSLIFVGLASPRLLEMLTLKINRRFQKAQLKLPFANKGL